MAFVQLQVTIGAAATRVSATPIPALEATFEAEQSSTNPMAVGPSGVTLSKGFVIQHATANMPSSKRFGPHVAGVIDLADFYIAGTAGEKCNVHYIPL